MVLSNNQFNCIPKIWTSAPTRSVNCCLQTDSIVALSVLRSSFVHFSDNTCVYVKDHLRSFSRLKLNNRKLSFRFNTCTIPKKTGWLYIPIRKYRIEMWQLWCRCIEEMLYFCTWLCCSQRRLKEIRADNLLTGRKSHKSVHTPTAIKLRWKNTSKHTSKARQQEAKEAAATAPRVVVQCLPTTRVMVEPVTATSCQFLVHQQQQQP